MRRSSRNATTALPLTGDSRARARQHRDGKEKKDGWHDMKIRWVAAAGVIGLIGALGAPIISQAATASPGVVRAHGTASVQVSACRPQQLRLQNGPRVSEKTQQETAIFVLRNASSRRCELDGYPDVALWTAHGRYLPFRYRQHGDQMLTSAKPHQVTLAPGGHAYFGINKNACVGRSTASARYLTMFPLGQLHQTLNKYPVLGYCDIHDPGHVVDISPFETTVRAVLAEH
jgi:hypothetical protein